MYKENRNEHKVCLRVSVVLNVGKASMWDLVLNDLPRKYTVTVLIATANSS